jgi:mRNA-decapping enzyme subunit 2
MEPNVEEVIQDVISRFLLDIPPEDALMPERLFFHIEEAHWFYTDFFSDVNSSYPRLSLEMFAENVFKLYPWLCKGGTASFMSHKFCEYKQTVPVCGGILFSKDMTKVLMVKNLGSNNWVFPRGKIEKNEDEVECALREVFEETGFDASPHLTEHRVVLKESRRMTTYIVFCGIPENTIFCPRTRKEISAVCWHSVLNIGKLDSRGYSPVKRILREVAQSSWYTNLGKAKDLLPREDALRSTVPLPAFPPASQFHFKTEEILRCFD